MYHQQRSSEKKIKSMSLSGFSYVSVRFLSSYAGTLNTIHFSNFLIIQDPDRKEIMRGDVFEYLMKHSLFLRP